MLAGFPCSTCKLNMTVCTAHRFFPWTSVPSSGVPAGSRPNKGGWGVTCFVSDGFYLQTQKRNRWLEVVWMEPNGKWCKQCAQSNSAQKPVRFAAAGRTHGQVFPCYVCSKSSAPACQRANLTGKYLSVSSYTRSDFV